MTEKLRRNQGYYISNGILCVAGYVVNKAISFFMIPILTRMMSTEDYGTMNTYTAWMAILAYVMGLALEYSIRTAFVDCRKKFDRHISAACSLSVFNLFIMGSVVFALNKFIFHQGSDLICLFCILHAYAHAIINYFNIKYTMLEQYTRRLALLLVPNLVSAVLGLVLIANFSAYKYMGRIWGFVLIFVPLGIGLILCQYRKIFCLYDKVLWKYALAVSLPMILHGLSTVVLSSSDRIIISTFRGDSETGIYSLVYNFIMVVVAVFNALENIWLPWFTKKMRQGNHEAINKMASYYLQLVAVLVCGLLLVAPEIITIMATKEYQSGRSLLIPLICSSLFIFLYSLSVSIEIYYKKTKSIAVNTMCAAMFNIVFDCILVRTYGMSAAAYVTLISYALSFAGHYACAKKLNPVLFPLKGYIVPMLSVFGVCILTTVFMGNGFIRWGIAMVIGVVYFIYAYVTFLVKQRC